MFAFALIVMGAGARSLTLLLLLVPLSDIALALLVARELRSVLGLPRTGRFVIGSFLCIGAGVLANGLVLVMGLDGLSRGYGALDNFEEAFLLATPIVTLTSAVSMAFVATGLGRAAAHLADSEAVARARWTQGLAVTGTTLLLGSLFGFGAAARMHTGDGLEIVMSLALAGIGTWLSVVVLHVMLVGRVHRTTLALLAPG